MNEAFIKSIYKFIIEENKEIYQNLFDNTIVDKGTDDYWKNSLKFYSELSYDNKEIFFNIIEQIIIDTISNMLNIIDGNLTLENSGVEPKLYLNNNYTDGELQDVFLEYVENTNK